MSKVYIGLDNGCTASIGVLGLECGAIFYKPPVKKCENYHKDSHKITRINFPSFKAFIMGVKAAAQCEQKELVCIMEKPYTGIATTAILAGRAYEAELIALELADVRQITIAASDWQGTKKNKGVLPSGLKKDETKIASMELGLKLWPELTKEITKHGDADGLLIAHWAMLKNL